MKDRVGKNRGGCNQCDCPEYHTPSTGHACDYCGHLPPAHKIVEEVQQEVSAAPPSMEDPMMKEIVLSVQTLAVSNPKLAQYVRRPKYSVRDLGSHSGMCLTARMDSSRILCGGNEGIVKVYDRREVSTLLATAPVHKGNVRALRVIPGAVVSGGADRNVNVMDEESYNVLWRYSHTDEINEIVFSQNVIASCGDDHKVLMYDRRTQQEIVNINLGQVLYGLDMDDTALLTSSRKDYSCLYDRRKLSAPQAKFKLSGTDVYLRQSMLFFVDQDIVRADRSTFQETAIVKSSTNHWGSQVVDDNTILATAGSNVQVVDVQKGIIGTLNDSAGDLYCLEAYHDGMLVTGSFASKFRVWHFVE